MPTLHYHNHQIHYEEYGQGAKLLLCLHGIAGRGKLFEKVTQPMWQDYKVVALDLPFHGPTEWEGDIYTDEELAGVVQVLLEQEGKTKFSIMAHSMGGRLVLGLLPHLVSQIEELYLFSPGGFQYVFTGSRIWWPLGARQWVRKKFEQPEGFVNLLHKAEKLKLIDRHLYLMLLQQVDTPERRARLLRSWASLYFFPMRATKEHKALLKQHQIPLHFFYGDKDNITPVHHAQKFIKDYPWATLEVVAGNHFFVKEDLVQPFKEWYEGQKLE